MSSNLKKYIRARRPIIWCYTSDYKEVDDLLIDAVKDIDNKNIYEFRALGVVDFDTKEIVAEGKSLYGMLHDIIFKEGFESETFLVIKDVQAEMEKPEVIAYLKKIAELCYKNPQYHVTTLIISSQLNTIPKELEKFVSLLELEMMKKEEIEQYMLQFGALHGVTIAREDIGEIAISLKGLTKLEIDHVLNMMIEHKKTISSADQNTIIKEKGQIIKKSAVLELIDFKEKIADIGGLEGLKEWLSSKSKIFRRLDEAKAYGVDVPKGVLLVGMPGCGKSLAAKASARLFNAPLLRLDIGRLLGKYVGESEQNMRLALKMAESISPCILWIDEIEKAFSGIDQSGGASDITKRLFGHFLTWLQEKENTVFVVATANDISTFPPEFLRKGRFDEVFFVDFPNEEERKQIFEIHLAKRGQDTSQLNTDKLAKSTNGYCGADIEEVVKLALEKSFVNGKKPITTEDIQESIDSIDSLTHILKDKIDILKKGFEKFKIKSASQSLSKKTRKGKNESDPFWRDMVYVQGGKYTPSFFPEEREVMDLEVCKYQTTQDMWVEIMGDNPSEQKGGRLPVTNISWWDALEYCNKLSEKYGLQPVYVLEKSRSLKINQLDGEIVYPDRADFRKTEGFRLPTELEWEWFARGGEVAIQDGTFDTAYAGSNNVDEVAWWGGNCRNTIHNVGQKKPNELGLYDCSGNVSECCYDTATNGYLEVERAYIFDVVNEYRTRGGYWCSTWSKDVETTVRGHLYLSGGSLIGFRIVRTI